CCDMSARLLLLRFFSVTLPPPRSTLFPYTTSSDLNGVFAALDAVLFYVFFEATLIPMFIIIGVWGGPNRVYAAVKFFLYTLFGSDRKSTRLNSSHQIISYAVFCLKKKNTQITTQIR